MKVRPSVKKICNKCKVIKRKGVIIIPIYIKKVKIKAFVKILCVVYLILTDSLINSIITIKNFIL